MELYFNQGLKKKIKYGIIIGLVVILLLTVSITIPLVLWRTGGFMPVFQMIINRSRQCFRNNTSSFEMTTTTDEHFYAAIRVSAVINNHRPSAIQINGIPHDEQRYLFRQGNQLSTRSSTIIYSVAMPLRNTSILDHEVIKARTTCFSSESIVTTLNDTIEQESE